MKKVLKKGAILLMAMLMAFETVPLYASAAEENAKVAKAAVEAVARENVNKKEVLVDETVFNISVDEPEQVPATNGEGVPPVIKTDGITSGTMGSNNGLKWNYNSSTKTMTVSGQETDFIGGYVGDAEEPISPFSYICPDVQKIIFNNCQLSGDMYFLFANLKTVKLIEFYNCNTSQVEDMCGLFYGCTALESLNLSSFNTAKVWDMSSMFQACIALKSVNLSSFNTAKVELMSGMFMGCKSLENLDISKFNTANVTDMIFMFYDCEKLKSLDVSNFNTTNVAYMSFMFTDCFVLENLNVSKWNTSNVEDMSYMFSGCNKLATLNLGSFNTAKVKYMDGMFDGCTSLKNLNISSFNTANVRDISYMFYNCSSMERLDLSNFNLGKVTDATGALLYCNSLNVINTPTAMPTGISIALPATFYTVQKNTVTEMTKDHSNSMLMKNLWTAGSRNINIASPESDITVANTIQLEICVNGEPLPVAENKDYTWSVSSQDVIKVSDTGLVTGVGMGTATVKCVHKIDSLETASYTFTVRIPFTDIKSHDWQYPFVVYAYENNLMSGTSESTFNMDAKLTRSQFVTVLYSYTGKPPVTFEAYFPDVADGTWYSSAVIWAKNEGVTAGLEDGTFGVENNITREQLVVMLYQYAKKTGIVSGTIQGDLSTYPDEAKVSSWAKDALTWAVQNSIISGKDRDGVNYLDPGETTTRGECATMMMRYVELAKQ